MEIPFISSKLPNSYSPFGKKFVFLWRINSARSRWSWKAAINDSESMYSPGRQVFFQYVWFTWHQEEKLAANLCACLGLNIMNIFLMQTTAFLKYPYLNWNQFIVNYLAIRVRAISMHTAIKKKKIGLLLEVKGIHR